MTQASADHLNAQLVDSLKQLYLTTIKACYQDEAELAQVAVKSSNDERPNNRPRVAVRSLSTT